MLKNLRTTAIGALIALLGGGAHAAVTLTPLPGSTPQTTHPYANTPVPIGVVATDNGVPVSGLAVTFELPSPGFYVINAGSNWLTVNTNAHGVATLPDPGLTASNTLGTFSWNAEEPGGATATFSQQMNLTDFGLLHEVPNPNEGLLSSGIHFGNLHLYRAVYH